MSESLTGTPAADTGLPTAEPTGEAAANVTAETSQETSSQAPQENGVPAETVSEATTAQTQTPTEPKQPEGEKQTQETEQAEEAQTDDGLAKFAKSQGFDPENLTDGERRALKIAQDNQKAFRSKAVADSKAGVEGGEITRDEIEAFKQEFRSYQAQRQAEAFFNEEGRDDALAPVMSEILEEKKKDFGAEYARVLSADLNLLYDLARVRQGSQAPVDAEAIRREERESINKQLASNTPSQHASQGGPSAPKKIDRAWIQNEYNPRNPEHVKLVDAYFAQ